MKIEREKIDDKKKFPLFANKISRGKKKNHQREDFTGVLGCGHETNILIYSFFQIKKKIEVQQIWLLRFDELEEGR